MFRKIHRETPALETASELCKLSPIKKHNSIAERTSMREKFGKSVYILFKG